MNPKVVQAQRISRSQMLLVGIAYFSWINDRHSAFAQTCNMPSPSTKHRYLHQYQYPIWMSGYSTNQSRHPIPVLKVLIYNYFWQNT